MLKRLIPLITLFALFAFALIASAQECSAFVQQALTLASDNCSQTGRNQACHGYINVEAQPRSNAEAFAFGLGDLADLTSVQSLTTSPLDEATGEWGVALLRVQANLPDTLPGENVTFLLFGDTQLDDMSADAGMNPMQAFRLRSSVTGTRCETAPQDGLLIQTPHGYGRIELQINGVEVSLGSTVFFEAEADGNLTISTLEGSAQVSVNGANAVALPGYSVAVPMDGNLNPAGGPSAPQPYDADAMAAMPVDMLEREVVLPEGENETATARLDTGTDCICALPTLTPVPAGNSGNVHVGNCGNGNGMGVANGCNGGSNGNNGGGNGNGNNGNGNGNGGGNGSNGGGNGNGNGSGNGNG
jgi:hypothetical protein